MQPRCTEVQAVAGDDGKAKKEVLRAMTRLAPPPSFAVNPLVS